MHWLHRFLVSLVSLWYRLCLRKFSPKYRYWTQLHAWPKRISFGISLKMIFIFVRSEIEKCDLYSCLGCLVCILVLATRCFRKMHINSKKESTFLFLSYAYLRSCFRMAIWLVNRVARISIAIWNSIRSFWLTSTWWYSTLLRLQNIRITQK